MEHLGPGRGLGQQGVVDLIAGENLHARGVPGFLAHGGPDVGIKVIGSGGGLGRIGGNGDAGSCPWALATTAGSGL